MCVLIFLGMVFYVDIIGLILGSNFRTALGTLPIILLSYIIVGILYNVSMWYKLSGQTKYAITITLLGLAITIIGNLIFMPRFSYWASAWVHLFSCLIMLIYSTLLGAKYYPIPYEWKKIIQYIFVAIGLYLLSEAVMYGISKIGGGSMSEGNSGFLIIKLTINTILILLYIAYIELNTKLVRSIVKKKN